MNDEFKELIQALAVIGSITASSIAPALRVARRQAKLVIPEEAAENQDCAAVRLTALTLIANGFLLLKNSTVAGKREELLEENIKFARYLIDETSLVDLESNEDRPSEKWISDEQLKRMFSAEES